MERHSALIMAAGTGSRLRPLTEDRPKCLVEVEGEPLLRTHLRVLASQGVDSVRLVAGYRADMLSNLGLPISLNERYESTNMVKSLTCALEHLNGPMIVAYGDILYSPEVLRTLLDTPGDMAVAVDLDWREYWEQRFQDPLSDAETLRMEDARIVEIGQKPSSLGDIQGQFMGLMRFSPRGIRALADVMTQAREIGVLGPRAFDQAYTTDLLTECIRQGHALTPARVFGGWVEIDTVKDWNLPVTRQRVRAIIETLDRTFPTRTP